MALIEQDYYRHQLLSPWGEEAFALRAQLIVQDTKLLLANGCDVIIEGVLPKDWFRDIYMTINADAAHVYYFDIPFNETVRRHAGRDKANNFGEETLRQWWREKDFLDVPGERVIDHLQSADSIVERIMADIGA